MDFDSILGHTLELEGGYVNHPDDTGGKTNYGVTQGTYDMYRDDMGLQRRSVRAIDRDEVVEIYRNYYWNEVGGPDLPRGLDLFMFDYAVNSGVYRAVVHLQETCNYLGGDISEDGVIGPETLGEVRNHPVFIIINLLYYKRMDFLMSLGNWDTFGRGWTNRINRVRDTALQGLDPTP